MKKIILAIIGVSIFIVGGYLIYQNTTNKSLEEKVANSYYQKLKEECQRQPLNKIKSCCFDSVKAMEVVGGILAKGDKVVENDCEDGYERMTLRCPGSLVWCQTDSNNGMNNNETLPVPQNITTINPAELTKDVICTADAKQCLDGTYVGRIGPNCEFAKCPGKPLKPDFVPTKDNPIQLPDNVISEKVCAAMGGEVWNSLGETSYEGELIGKVEGLDCPCACLVKPEPTDVIWVNINGNLEEFKGNLDDIKTFNDCAQAGFSIKDEEPEICTVGEPYMLGNKYKTFYNHPWGEGKSCTDYHYSTCPGSCVATCKSSSCSNQENGTMICTSDCDGEGSCIER